MKYISLLLCGSLLAVEPAGELLLTGRSVHYGQRDIIPIQTRTRFTTVLVLPKSEQILDYVCGDKEFWTINGAQNFAYVKPTKTGAQTNLNLITASGNVYSFTLSEVGKDPDLKVFIEPKEDVLAAMEGAPRFVAASEIDNYRKQWELAKVEAQEAKAAAQAAIEEQTAKFRETFPAQLKHDYRFKANERPFNVSAMFNDGKFTYIQAEPQEVPALYEVKDDKPNLVEFQFKDGTYFVPKIIDRGYLQIGKAKMEFYRAQ